MDFAAARRNMIDGQILPNRVSDNLVMDAFESIPREQFVSEALRSVAYTDEDLALGRGRFLLEASVLARLLQAAALEQSDKVLVVAGASGYSAAVVAQLSQSVTLLDSDAAFLAHARTTLANLGLGRIAVVEGDVTHGYAANGPYNVILIDGAVGQVPPALLDQLADGGRVVAVVQQAVQGVATLFERHGGIIGQVPVFDANVPALAEFNTPSHFVF